MLKARQGKELVLRTANEIGELAKLSKSIAEKGLNILAMSCYAPEEKDVILVDGSFRFHVNFIEVLDNLPFDDPAGATCRLIGTVRRSSSGSARIHVSCRFASRRVAVTARSLASSGPVVPSRYSHNCR